VQLQTAAADCCGACAASGPLARSPALPRSTISAPFQQL